ncbi:MAG: UDP-N-acetylglucosamine 1-carboxyvinyltransferase [Bdellovibrionota bacterium]
MSSFIIEGGRPINGSVRPSGNKNEALPALVSCLLTDEPITLKRVPKIRDVVTICEILEYLGVKVEWHSEEELTLDARTANNHIAPTDLCARVRASILLIGPLLSRFGKVELGAPGGDVIGARRIDTHFEGIIALGAELRYDTVITGSIKNIMGTEIFLDEPSVTATENLLLLSVISQGTTVLHNAACEPHVNGIAKLLNSMGAKISGIGTNQLKIDGVAKLHGTTHTIGPDFMEVGSFICLGAIGGGKITIEEAEPEDLRFVFKTFNRLGIQPEVKGKEISIDGNKPMNISNDITGRIATIYSGPWPAFPTDLMSVTIVAATQASGTIVFFEKMFEGRMFFTDKLISMGANIVLCDPHRIVVTGPSQLYGAHLSSPDVRAGMSMLMAAAIAKGTSQINNIYQIERGYYQIGNKLESLGVAIRHIKN